MSSEFKIEAEEIDAHKMDLTQLTPWIQPQQNHHNTAANEAFLTGVGMGLDQVKYTADIW